MSEHQSFTRDRGRRGYPVRRQERRRVLRVGAGGLLWTGVAVAIVGVGDAPPARVTTYSGTAIVIVAATLTTTLMMVGHTLQAEGKYARGDEDADSWGDALRWAGSAGLLSLAAGPVITGSVGYLPAGCAGLFFGMPAGILVADAILGRRYRSETTP